MRPGNRAGLADNQDGFGRRPEWTGRRHLFWFKFEAAACNETMRGQRALHLGEAGLRQHVSALARLLERAAPDFLVDDVGHFSPA